MCVSHVDSGIIGSIKMKMYFLETVVLLLCFLFGASSCTDGNRMQTGEELETIGVGRAIANREEVKLSGYASSIEYIPLENCDEAQLTKIDYESYSGNNGRPLPYYKMVTGLNRDYAGFRKFLYSNNLLLFFYPSQDACSKQVCHVFDMKGNFVRKIGYDSSDASLSGQYCYVRSNYVNNNNLSVIIGISDFKNGGGQKNKLLIYDINTGELLESLPYKGDNFINIDTTLNFYKTEENNVSNGHIVDADFHAIDNFLICRETLTKRSLEKAKNPRIPGMGMKVYTKSFVHKSVDGFVVLKESADTISRISFIGRKGECKPAYRLDYADTLSSVTRNIKVDILNYAESEELVFMQITENQDYPFGKWTGLDNETKKVPYYKLPSDIYNNQIYKGKNPVCHILYNKVSGETKSPVVSNSLWVGGFTNDIDGGAPFWPEIVDDGKMFQVVKAVDFIKLSKIYNSPEMKAVAGKITTDSNPVVIVVTLK